MITTCITILTLVGIDAVMAFAYIRSCEKRNDLVKLNHILYEQNQEMFSMLQDLKEKESEDAKD